MKLQLNAVLGALILLATLVEASTASKQGSEGPGDSQIGFPKDELDRLAKDFRGRLGFYAKDLTTGIEYSRNADQRFPPASVIKLPVMIELHRQAAAGRLKLDHKRRLSDDISTHGSGVLKKREGEVELSNRPIVISAFALSDDPKDRSRREILARMSRLIIEAVDPAAATALPEPPASQDGAPK